MSSRGRQTPHLHAETVAQVLEEAQRVGDPGDVHRTLAAYLQKVIGNHLFARFGVSTRAELVSVLLRGQALP